MKFHLVFCIALAAGFLTNSAAFSQTIGYAQAADRLGAACGADIQKYCKNVNLGNGRIRNCLLQHNDRVSSQCKTTFRVVFELIQKRAVAQTNIKKLCGTDARRLCPDMQMGDGNILNCLLVANRVVSRPCNQAITDAGYR